MNIKKLSLTSICLAVLPAASFAAAGSPLKTESQKMFYTLGVVLGRNADLGRFSLTRGEVRLVVEGFGDAAEGRKLKVNPNAYIQKLNNFARARQKAQIAAEQASGAAYLAKARKEKGAQISPSGLIYTAIKEGAGARPKATDTVTVNYTGRLTDGKIFDSSSQHGGPATFRVNGVIPCWTEGLQKMKAGGKAKLVCPSDIAYGDRGMPPVIPPKATLIFDVQLLAVKGR
ncbi:MAG TPA: FKBP-type peptidyl-prolyl cis-trans isomerase [Elusimicrobiota bacterium]|nr:FKBP-type peptidyl-prolyl cis-trans isomerase [Elusimicrobiota bacterium]